MTIEATFENASLISPRTCCFAALSIVCSCCARVARIDPGKATTLSRWRIERVARDREVAWCHSSPQAASEGTRPKLGTEDPRRLLRRGLISTSVVQYLSSLGDGRAVLNTS